MKRLSGLWLACLVGCSSFIHGPDQILRITTAPPDASIHINDSLELKGGGEFKAARSERFLKIKAEKEGYKPKDVLLKKSQTTAFALGGFFFPSMIVDYSTGSVYGLKTDEVHIVLESAGGAPVVSQPGQGGLAEAAPPDSTPPGENRPTLEKIDKILFSDGSGGIRYTDSVFADHYNDQLIFLDLERNRMDSIPFAKISKVQKVDQKCGRFPFMTLAGGLAGFLLGGWMDSNCISDGAVVSACGGYKIVFGVSGALLGIAGDINAYTACLNSSYTVDSLKRVNP